jgi:hypothetical protein
MQYVVDRTTLKKRCPSEEEVLLATIIKGGMVI